MKSKIFRLFTLLVLVSMIVTPASAQSNRPTVQAQVTGPAEPGAPVQVDTGVPGRYIVQLVDQPLGSYRGTVKGLTATSPSVTGAKNLDVKSPAAQAYLNYLAGKQNAALSSIKSVVGHAPKVVFTYKTGTNGFAMYLTPAEAARVSKLSGVKAVVADVIFTADTDHGPAWIGAPRIWNGTSTGDLPGTKGEGVVVGVLDTGINETHPSFAEVGGDGYHAVNPLGPGTFLGVCDPGNTAIYTTTFVCNDKLIGAWNLVTPDMLPAGAIDYKTPEDENGHGSHTSSTAAGNIISATLIAPTMAITHTISGVAPHANLIFYDISYTTAAGTGSATGASILAAIDQAITDSVVNVINFSFGSTSPSNPFADVEDGAFLTATDTGIFVSQSAGNSGPAPSTETHDAPWTMTVAASTHNRVFRNAVINMSGDGTPPADLVGVGLTGSYGPHQIVYSGNYGDHGVDAQLCFLGAFPAGTWTNGEIVVCDRGTNARVDKAVAVKNGGAGGFVLANTSAAQSIVADGYAVPGVLLAVTQATALKTWIASGTNHLGSIQGTFSDLSPANGDIMASFSSRGPSTEVDVIKPDVAAPGVDIWAANLNTHYGSPGPADFILMSGTSMAAPHDAGAAALLKSLHPAWTPEEIKSALMMTSKTSTMLKEDGVTPATVWDMGAGRIDLNFAGNAGLVLNETTANFIAADPSGGGDPRSLNLASLQNTKCLGSCTWTRVFSSTLDTATTYAASVSATPGITVTVTPDIFTIAAHGTQSVVVKAEMGSYPVATWAYGRIDLTPMEPSVVVPLESFDGATFPPTGWSSLNVDGDTTQWVRDTTSTHTGAGRAVHTYGPNNGTMEDGWLFMPAFDVTANTSLSFWDYINFPSDYFKHSLWTCPTNLDCTNTANFTQLVEVPPAASSTWTTHQVDLASLAGQNIVLAFRYEGVYADRWAIDDVSVVSFEASTELPALHLPLAVQPIAAQVPALVTINTTHRTGSQDVTGYQIASPVITLTQSVAGLAKATIYDEMVPVDTTNANPYDGNGVLVKTVVVPPGAKRLVAEIMKSTALDVDMYVGTGTTPSAATVACTSATGAILEYCNIDNPAPGTYWVLAQNWASSTGTDEIKMAVAAVPAVDAGDLTVTGPASVPAAEMFGVTLHWNEPAFSGVDRWYGAVTFGTSPANPSDIGTTDVDVRYTQPVVTSKVAPASADHGSVMTYKVVVDGQGAELRNLATLTDTLPAGVEFAGNLSASYGTAAYNAGTRTVTWSNNQFLGNSVSPATAPASKPIQLRLGADKAALGTNGAGAVAPAAPNASVLLAVDDGTPESAVGVGGTEQFLVLNRFTPAAAAFPFNLTDVEVAFVTTSAPVAVGDPIEIVLYKNPSGNVDPSVGATLLAKYTTTISAVNAWSTYTLPSPVRFDGPGDVLVGVIALKMPGTQYYFAPLDTDSTKQLRSWVGDWSTVTAPVTPTLPVDGFWATIDAAGIPGNWTIRGDGATIPLPATYTVTFDVTVTAAGGTDVVNTADIRYNDEAFPAQATTAVVSVASDVTFVYHDLEDVVPVGTDVYVAGDFNTWNPSANIMAHNAAYSVFTATLPLNPGSYQYKYVVGGTFANGGGDVLQTNNRDLTVTGAATLNDYRDVVVGWANLSGPAAQTVFVLHASAPITGQVWINNVTNPAGAGNLKGQLGYGAGSDPATWTWIDMTFVSQLGNNDVLSAVIPALPAGVYHYAVRYDGNYAVGNPNADWAYADLNGPGFDIAHTGTLTVLPFKMIYLPVVIK